MKDQLKELVPLALQQDQRAQSQIITLTQSRLFKFCILLGHNRELAEDLCQEAFIKAFANLSKLDTPESFYPWLCQIAKNLFFDHNRKQKEKLSENENEESGDSSDSSMEDIIQVQRVLKEFDPNDRFLLLMVELEGLSYKETGEQLKMSEDAVRSKLHRLRQEFVKKLG